ncbi:NADPH:quinone reductase-like Zn-dependent oxidoreductase [Bradyrhizobium sp. GM24.11]
MRVIIFGATGMVGQGVLRECLVDAGVERVLVVGRSPTGVRNAKLTEIIHDDFTDYSKIAAQLTDYDACFFCLGVSSIGMSEERYRHLTYDVTLAAATTLARLNPQMTFTYVTGARHRFHRAGLADVGARQGQDRERSAQAAVQGGLHVPARRDPASARDPLEDGLGAGGLRRDLAAVVGAAPDLARARHLDRADGPRHDPCRPGWLSQERA